MRHFNNFCSRPSIYAEFNILTGEIEDFNYSNLKICHGGKGGGGTNTVTSNAAPPADVTANYDKVMSQAFNVAGQPLQQYGGPTVAGFTPDQMSAFGTINNAQGSATPFINSAAQLIGQGTQPLWNNVQQFSPQNVSQYMSPYTGQVLNSAVAQQQNTDAQQQQALTGNAISSGAFGGDRAGVASAALSGQQDIANNATNAGILNQAYTQGLGEFNTQQQAQLGANEANSYLAQQGAFGLGNLGNEALGTQLQGASAQLQSGGLQQQLGQEALNVPYENFLQQQAYPFQTTSYLANLATGLGSGQGGTSSTTSPSPSILSQIGGLGIGGLGLAGSLGWAPFAKRGGRINGYDSGGSVSLPTDVPDVSVSYVPQGQTQQHSGLGIPKPPQPYQAPDPVAQAANFVGAMGQHKFQNHPQTNSVPMSPAAAQTWQTGESQGMPFGQIAPNAAQASNDANFMGPLQDSGFGAFLGHKRGGVAHYDDGGTVGGVAPNSMALTGQQQPTISSNLQNMTPEQLQQYVMRLPIGSQQQKQATAVLQQKRMMPNTGAAAQGGLGSQPQQPMFGGYAGGGDVLPPDPQSVANIEGIQSDIDSGPTGESGNAPSMAPQGGMGAMQGAGLSRQPTASATPPLSAQPSAPKAEEDTKPNSRAPASPNPWLALAEAGFATAAGNSPHALQNIGAGAMAGIQNYGKQQQESDTVNEAADKLMSEAKIHKDQLAIEQQNADRSKQQTEQQGQYQQGMLSNEQAKLGLMQQQLQQGKYEVKPDQYGNLVRVNTRTGETSPVEGSTPSGGVILGPDGTPLTGQAYLDNLSKTNSTLAHQIKAMDEGDLNFPSNNAAKAPYWQQRLDALYQYNPEASQQTASAYKQFMSGPIGNTVRSINVTTNHLDLADKLIDAMDNGDTKALNQLGNVAKTQFGLSTAPTNLDAVKTLLSGELEKAAAGNIGAVTDRQELATALNSANSPELLHGVTQQFKSLMGGQYGGLQQQYESQTGRKDFSKFLTPASKEAINLAQGVAGQNTSGQTAPSAPALPSWAKGPLQYNAALKQYRDPATKTIYDINGNTVQ